MYAKHILHKRGRYNWASYVYFALISCYKISVVKKRIINVRLKVVDSCRYKGYLTREILIEYSLSKRTTFINYFVRW